MANIIKYPSILPTIKCAVKAMHVQHILSLGLQFFVHFLHFFPFLYVPNVLEAFDSVPEPSGIYPHGLFWVLGTHLILKLRVGTGLAEN